MKLLWNECANLWCRTMHRKTMWPIHGAYRCHECLRVHKVSWAAEPVVRGAVRLRVRALEPLTFRVNRAA